MVYLISDAAAGQAVGAAGQAPGSAGQALWKVNHLVLAKGARISARTGGGGGYGPPWERSIRNVMDDLLDGYINREAAESQYGLRFQDDDYELDYPATSQARWQLAGRSTQFVKKFSGKMNHVDGF